MMTNAINYQVPPFNRAIMLGHEMIRLDKFEILVELKLDEK